MCSANKRKKLFLRLEMKIRHENGMKMKMLVEDMLISRGANRRSMTVSMEYKGWFPYDRYDRYQKS